MVDVACSHPILCIKNIDVMPIDNEYIDRIDGSSNNRSIDTKYQHRNRYIDDISVSIIDRVIKLRGPDY